MEQGSSQIKDRLWVDAKTLRAQIYCDLVEFSPIPEDKIEVEVSTTPKPKIESCAYIRRVVDGVSREGLIENALEVLKPRSSDFASIAVRGMSGATIGAILAYLLKKDLIIVRKSDHDTHSTYNPEGRLDGSPYIIVDDLISSGYTMRAILNKIKSRGVLVGAYLYNVNNEEAWLTPDEVRRKLPKPPL